MPKQIWFNIMQFFSLSTWKLFVPLTHEFFQRNHENFELFHLGKSAKKNFKEVVLRINFDKKLTKIDF